MDNIHPDPMVHGQNQDIEEIVEEISQRRARLANSLERLGYRLNKFRQWRRWIQAHPLLSLVSAATLGILLGKGHHFIHHRTRSHSERI